MRIQPKYNVSNLAELDLSLASTIEIDEMLAVLNVPPSDEIELLIKEDVAHVASYCQLELRAPTTAQRAAAIRKLIDQAERIRNTLSALEPRHHETVSQALSQVRLLDSMDPIDALCFVRTAIVHLRREKYRVKRTKLDRVLHACPLVLCCLDDCSESDLLNGMLYDKSRPKTTDSANGIETLRYCLDWIARGGATILPTVSKPGVRWTPGLHTAISYLAPRYEQLTGQVAKYWGNPDDIPPNSFEPFVAFVFKQAKMNTSTNQIHFGIRTYCQAQKLRLSA